MARGLLPIALLAAFASSDASAIEYAGVCEVSAGTFIGPKHFAVASDESNKLQVYERGKPKPVGSGIDMVAFTSFDKSDLEGAAALGDRVYWISSHSFTKKGKDSAKRKVFFATKIEQANGKVTLKGVGQPALSLRDPLAKAAGVEPRDMDIEALAPTTEGGLLIGLRKPLLSDGRALIIPFKNPAGVVDHGAQPEFGAPIRVYLGGRGLRSMDLLAGAQYIIVAGAVSDSPVGFAVFRWSGPGTEPVAVKGLNLMEIRPEAAMAVPGQDLVQLLSDDGDICSDEDDPPSKRKFKSIDIKP